MTSITVQRTGFGIVVAESDDAEAAALLDGLPPLRAARYLTATPALRDALRSADAELVDAVLPHLDGEVVVPEAGLARLGDDGEAESTRLAQALGVSVVAPEGRIVRCEGTLFSVGGDGWIAQSPVGARVRAGRRYPAPAWQSQLPESLRGAAHIPAGLWITAGSEPRHAVRLADVAVRERQLLVVAGSPSEPAPSEERLLTVLRSLPVETRSAVVLAGFGAGSLPLDAVRSLAAALDQPLRVAHGVELGGGAAVRIDGDEDALPATLALESVCAPDGTVTLERWTPPPGLVAANALEYRLGETPTTRRRPGDRWVVHVVAAGLVVRPVGQPLVDGAALEAPAGSLGIFVQCDGAHRPSALPALLAPLLERLEQRSAVTIHPVDGAARRVVRDAYPGAWAPTESLAITADGRIVAATTDASGDTDVAGEASQPHAVAAEAAQQAVPEVEHRESATEGERHDAEAAAGGEARDVVERAEISPATIEAAAAQPAAAQPAAGRPERTRTQPAASEEPRVASRSTTTVDAVIGAADAAPAPEESAGAAQRRARDARVTNVPSADTAADAWYAAAVRRPTPTAASGDAPQPAEAQPAPAPAATTRAPEPAAPAARQPRSAVPPAAEATGAAAAADVPAAPPRASGGASSDALARALQGSASARLLGTGARGAAAAPRSTPATEADAGSEAAIERAAGTAQQGATPGATEAETTIAAASIADAVEQPPVAQSDTEATPVVAQRSAAAIDVPLGVGSTADQRHRVRTALGSRYDVASRTVSQLLAQQPGMRVASDRSAMLTGLSLVRVFATDPHADYDLDFHTCLAEGLATLPTARSVVVRGIPAGLDATPGSLLRLRTPLVAAAADAPATGPAEALIWTTSGRRLDRVLHGTPDAADVVLPAGTRLRVLGSAEGPSPRLLLAEESADAEQALARLQAAADARGEVGAHAIDRWFGDLPLAA